MVLLYSDRCNCVGCQFVGFGDNTTTVAAYGSRVTLQGCHFSTLGVALSVGYIAFGSYAAAEALVTDSTYTADGLAVQVADNATLYGTGVVRASDPNDVFNGDILDASDAPAGVFLQAGDPAFSKLRQVCHALRAASSTMRMNDLLHATALVPFWPLFEYTVTPVSRAMLSSW